MSTERFYNRNDSRYAHPEVAAEHELFLADDVNAKNIAIFDVTTPYVERKQMVDDINEYAKGFLSPRTDRTSTFEVPGLNGGDGSIVVEIARPTDAKPGKKLPCIFNIPAGALYACSYGVADIEGDADECGAVVINMRYRTAFDDKGIFPGALDDLEATYRYVLEHEDELGIKKDKIVVMGLSSGGHLGLAFCHRLKKLGITPRGCVAIEPIPDERTIYPSSHIVNNNWDGRSIYASGAYWLGFMPTQDVPAEAFANHATAEECIGLPPTIIYVGEDDAAADPCLSYYSKLNEAGVFASIHIWGGANHMTLCHGDNPYVNRIIKSYRDDIKDLFKNDMRRPWTVGE